MVAWWFDKCFVESACSPTLRNDCDPRKGLVVTLLYILKVKFELHLVFLFLSCLFSVLFSCVDNA